MTGAGGQRALDDTQRDFILDLIAEYQPPRYICRAFQREFGRSIARSLVSYYKANEKHRDGILLRRARLKATILDRIPIASKYHRLKALDKLFDTENRYRVVRWTKGTDARGNECQLPVFEKPVGELRALLQLAAQEMGDLTEVHVNIAKPRDEYVATFDDGEAYEDAPASEAEDVPTEIVN